MGMGAPNNGSSRVPTALSEINVTPLVDVMLVLLIIFMITASVETVEAQREEQLYRQEQMRRLEEMKIEEDDSAQQVPVNLPKVNSERINLTQEQKLVLTFTESFEFYLGTTAIIKCHEVAPGLAAELEAGTATGGIPAGFRVCLAALEAKLLENEKLKTDGELYLRADRGLDYGLVLTVMARIRKAGVTSFGLVAEPDLEE